MIDAQKVSVCTRVYNTKPYLAQCVTSVLSQTYKNIEYIIVDNGCTDGSKELLEEFAAKDKRIKLYRFEENRVAPLEFQMLLSHASGKYFTILDSDDWWESDYLERLVLLMEENNLDCIIKIYLKKGTEAEVIKESCDKNNLATLRAMSK